MKKDNQFLEFHQKVYYNVVTNICSTHIVSNHPLGLVDIGQKVTKLQLFKDLFILIAYCTY